MEHIIGVDIGGTKIAIVYGKMSKDKPEIVERITFLTGDYPCPQDAVTQIKKAIATLSENHRIPIDSIGVSCGGPLNSVTGCILSPPNLPGWNNIPIVDLLSSEFNVPVALQNDANACAVAEWKFGAAQGYDDVVFLTFGTGLGAGLILNGKLYPGRSDTAGEVGHWRLERFGPVGYGKAGSFEGFCSGGGIAILAAERVLELQQMGQTHPLQREKITAMAVFALARAGDSLCIKLVEQVGRYFGKGLALILDILNPQIVVAGSIFTRNYDLLYPFAMKALEQEALPAAYHNCKLVPSTLGESIGDYAALSVALLNQKSEATI